MVDVSRMHGFRAAVSDERVILIDGLVSNQTGDIFVQSSRPIHRQRESSQNMSVETAGQLDVVQLVRVHMRHLV